MLTLCHSIQNGLITMLRLRSSLSDPQVEIPERTELTILDHVSPRHLIEIEAWQPIDRIHPRYHEGKSTSPYRTKLNKSSHNIPTMTQPNH
jgi:hypothetical protein